MNREHKDALHSLILIPLYRSALSIVLLLWTTSVWISGQASQTVPPGRNSGLVDFVKEIQPIFKASCYSCHGPELQMGQLRLDSKPVAFQGGISGRTIVPGKSPESLLLQRVLGLGGKVRMPLQGEPLREDQTQLIREWIDQGALWPEEASAASAQLSKHWAYVKPVRPDPPKVKDSKWIRNPVDAFILARLEKEGLSQSPEAPSEVLFRRVSLDLTGLPPKPAEVDAALHDSGSLAYEKWVERLLSSPHFGERWARPWLDLARYADSNGYESDQKRSIWKYRDWVIDALNQDMPFNQFTIEQIAGDLLPAATLEQRIATGFHRNTMLNLENGVDQLESRWNILVDRVNTTVSVWLGTTLACAQCHNHKYDPFSQQDFYRFLAFFENGNYELEGEGSYQKLLEPVLELPTSEQEAKRRQLRQEIAQLEQTLQAQTPNLDAEQARWEGEAVKSSWHVLSPTEFRTAGSATFAKLEDGSVLVTVGYDQDTYVLRTKTTLKGIRAFQLEVLPDPSLDAGGPGRSPQGNFVLTSFGAEVTGGAPAMGIPLLNAQADFSERGFPVTNAIDQDPQSGWAILPRHGEAHSAWFETRQPVGDGGETRLTFTLEHASRQTKALIGRFRLSASVREGNAGAPPVPDEIRSILALSKNIRTEEQARKLADYHRLVAPSLEPVRKRLHELRKELDAIPIATTLVMRERPSAERPHTYLRLRGNYLHKGEKVYADVPTALHRLPESQMPNRLGLAHWLVDENNPLVARVTVNRCWEQIFGRGLVETSEDFGTRGDRPRHPELLDWLATEFVRQGWSTKALLRLLVLSSTYRQSSRVTPALLEKDSDNQLLSRGPRFRMEAEMIRDAALEASGLLSRKIGGPSVFPFQPEGIWNLLSNDKWVMSDGEDRYRRGLYTFWRRSAPYPSFLNFDATSREYCTVRRIRTNTPLQSLTTLNEPTFFDAARGLARRMLAEGGGSDESRARHGFRLCVTRHPRPDELQQILEFLGEQLIYYRSHPADAGKLAEGASSQLPADPSEIAAWTMVANLLLNLDQTLTKE